MSATVPKSRRMNRWLVTLGVSIVLCVLAYPFERAAVQAIRATIKGVPPAQLLADDLADDVRTEKRLVPLQDWSAQTLDRYRIGKVATAGKSAYAGSFSMRLDQKEIPTWLSGAWGLDRPEVSIALNWSNKEPECIVIGWYLSGLLVGPTNYVTTWQPWYIVQVKPGIYAYSIEK